MPIFRLPREKIFPHPHLAEDNGLLAIGGGLSPERLLKAYRSGIFPWYSEGDPILWWFTSPRLVIYPGKIHISKRLARYMRKPLYRVTADLAFEEVIASCAFIRRQNDEGTWITDGMREAYVTLHRMGYAHSIECWHGDNLVGGLYGVALGRVFFGESMFSRMGNASKIALASLARFLHHKGFQLIDCQMTTDHLMQFGAVEISGNDFSGLLSQYILDFSTDGTWKDESFNQK